LVAHVCCRGRPCFIPHFKNEMWGTGQAMASVEHDEALSGAAAHSIWFVAAGSGSPMAAYHGLISGSV
jgi:hypothetical protein